ncbi:hypothetical protein CPLU01_11140 [Colletotrichum plurivorum]|uniref:C2H2-type domain-containing protein n=1 Tax=Colletotrichum plurivorum TaxID=2175906 RepID=A0A8H6K450_9PEZI|nr:hypothetical protein CPLU01_11140 [Colletotrichum plurivorum]
MSGPVACPHCQLRFPRNTERNKHVRTKHRPKIKCPVVGCTHFRFPYNKDMHRHVWNAHKLYAADPRNKIPHYGGYCPEDGCDLHFTRLDNLKRHRETIHLKLKKR